MDDQDYIRKAVELADGWQYDEIGHTGIYKIFLPDTMNIWVSFDYQPALDAIAAQLVRQVEDIDSAWLDISSCGYVSIFVGDGDEEVATQFGDDRTMNTIKAIVDSAVLAEDK